MDINIVLNKVINIANDYYQKNKSKFSLVQESGYLETHEVITENLILQGLKEQPEHITEWIAWSEDQRVSEGWFLKIDNNRFFVVDFSTKGGYKETLHEYLTIEAACAAFIKRQIEFSRKLWLSENEKKKK